MSYISSLRPFAAIALLATFGAAACNDSPPVDTVIVCPDNDPSRDNCETPCEGDDCETPCEGDDCETPCEGDDCEIPCESDDCGKPCDAGDTITVVCGSDDRGAQDLACNNGVLKASTPCCFVSSGMSNGLLFNCALNVHNEVECWGDNWQYQHGNGLGADAKTPARVSHIGHTLPAATSVTLARAAGCAILANRDVACWGNNFLGQMQEPGGMCPHFTCKLPTPVTRPAMSGDNANVKALVAGHDHFCAHLNDDSVSCWASSSSGQGGAGEWGFHHEMRQAVGIDGRTRIAKQLIAGRYHNCVLTTLGEVQCWGSGGKGALGNGSLNNSNVPITVQRLTDEGTHVVRLGEGQGTHNCALLSDNSVKCWGDNTHGQVSSSLAVEVDYPAVVIEASEHNDIASLSLGYSHTCALFSDSRVLCWGSNNYGELGQGHTDAIDGQVFLPGYGPDATRVSQVVLSQHGTCVVAESGATRCVGYNVSGQLGNGTQANTTAWTYVLADGDPKHPDTRYGAD